MSDSASQSAAARFIVGIDLGTTNCAVAFVDTGDEAGRLRVFPVTQFVGPGEVEARETLPSFHYAPTAAESAGLRLPWQSVEARHVVGVWAREQGAMVPGRVVTSAKSWLSHSGVDRTAAFLPWHGVEEVEKLSPMEVSARYLGQIRAAWNHRWPQAPLEEQDVILTIPASFDEIARELTIQAAQRAGLRRVVLIEEPQAAFYAWIHSKGDRWQSGLSAGQRILVCDVGGGTTDFTLIEVQAGGEGGWKFHRYAVGEHLILGGDNLDLALAHRVEERLTPGGRLPPGPWSVLVRRCQQAKELLLSNDAPARTTIAVPAGGSRLIGGSISAEVTRDEVLEWLVDGFLPRVGLEEKPARTSSGFREFGLPYAADPAITRYLAAFLTAHARDGSARPDVVLFNGGLFQSEAMRSRLLEVLASWFSGGTAGDKWRPLVLENERLDLAVAMGAAYYGRVRRGQGARISGGLPRSYYIGIDRDGGTSALCLVPAGLEEGQEARLPGRRFDLLIRSPVEFPLYVSASRTTDRPGDLVVPDEIQLTALPSIRTVLQAGRKSEAAEHVAVELHARLTEIGTLELWCSEVGGVRRWRLQFDVRSATQTEVEEHGGAGERSGFVEEAAVTRTLQRVRQVFGGAEGESVAPERLVRAIEEATGMGRLDWPPSLLRQIWQEVLEREPARKRSVMHEARWLNLLGFALRPGFGFAIDDWRVAQTWQALWSRKVAHPGNEMCRAEWWILWRRIAGGLVAGQQRVLADPLLAALRARDRAERSRPAGGGRGRGAVAAEFRFGSHESEEVWRLLGSLESLAVEVKAELGELICGHLDAKGPDTVGGSVAWALGRVGSRVPLHGPLQCVLPAERVEAWIERVISRPDAAESLWFPVVQMARRTGDRFRDVSEEVRGRVVTWLEARRGPAHFLQLVREGGELERSERDLVFGERLPTGLRLR